MISFENDYSEGALPEILDRFLRTNLTQESGYGNDRWSLAAADKIRASCKAPAAEIFFLTGGTQVNAFAIDMLLSPCEGVICAETGHINVHEAGAIEFTGHKVMPLPGHEGKIDANELAAYLDLYLSDETLPHMVQPGMVYLSWPTEFGTLYSKSDLENISAIAHARGLRLFLDGARMGYGLASPACDVTTADIARLCDAFTIGGTKVGALCGEALIIAPEVLPAHTITRIKQHGTLLAKGKLTGLQFDTLFSGDLYQRAARHAVEQAMRLRFIFHKYEIPLYLDSPTNQQFVVLPNSLLQDLRHDFVVSVFGRLSEDTSIVRFCTSWATDPASIDVLESWFAKHCK